MAKAPQHPRKPTSLKALNRIIAASPPLVPGATQAVLGEGPIGAPMAFVGEQPGDIEDLQGRPFVGPAGRLLDTLMEKAKIARDETYLTNAVKHFKFELRGKKRLHKRPTAAEVEHYRWWLDLELDFVAPKIIVALGATAVLALARKALPIERNRGPTDFVGRRGYILVHPSSLLRIPDEAARRKARVRFVDDLKHIRALAEGRQKRTAAG